MYRGSNLSPDNPGGPAECTVVHNFDLDQTNPGFNTVFSARLNPSDNSASFLPQDFAVGNFMELPEMPASSAANSENAHQMAVLVRRLPETNMAANLF